MREEDKRIVEACLNDRQNGWEEFHKAYSSSIKSCIRSTASRLNTPLDTEVIDDIFQQLLLKLMKEDCKKLRQFKGLNSSSLKTWLYVVTSRITINHLKRESKFSRKTVPLEEIDPPSDRHFDLDAKIDANSAMNQLKEIISQQLDSREQLLIRLLFMEEFEPLIVARVLGITTNHVYVLKNRVLNKLKKLFCKIKSNPNV